MSFNQQHLNNLLREIKNISPDVLNSVKLQAGMTDYDFNLLIDYSDDIVDDIRVEFQEDIDIEEQMKLHADCGVDYEQNLLDIAIKLNEPIECKNINKALEKLDQDKQMICLDLFDFDNLSIAAQNIAIKNYMIDGVINPISFEKAKEYLEDSNELYFFDGHLFDRNELGL